MKSIHSKLPNKQFELPGNVESVEICSTTGKLASTGCKSTILEYYLEGTAPTEYCSEHGSVPKSYRDSYDTTPSPTLEPTPSHETEQNPTPSEPEPVVEAPSDDPNKKLSADEIAAMFGSAEDSVEKQPEEAVAEPEPEVTPEPEPAAEESAADPLAGLDMSDPNKVLSADEIQKLFSNM
jgi:hypothetical protein